MAGEEAYKAELVQVYAWMDDLKNYRGIRGGLPRLFKVI